MMKDMDEIGKTYLQMQKNWKETLRKNEGFVEKINKLEKEKEVLEISILTLEEVITEKDDKIKKIEYKLENYGAVAKLNLSDEQLTYLLSMEEW